MVAKEIKIPDIDTRLAEFIGVHIGDGTLTPNLLRISGNKLYDYHYFLYLQRLVLDLFGLKASILFDRRRFNQRNTILLSIPSKKLAEFMHDVLGMPYGDKIRGKCRIPKEILRDDELTFACLRGLVDTDGSISRRDNYMCLSFDSHNPILLDQVWKIGNGIGIFTYRFKNQIGTNSWPRIVTYYKIIGSSNLSYIIRFSEKLYNNRRLYKTEVVNYFDMYKNKRLPFKIRARGLVAMTSA